MIPWAQNPMKKNHSFGHALGTKPGKNQGSGDVQDTTPRGGKNQGFGCA